jgi:2-iminobutanoate/2-iminopropanoate deaminase
MPITSARAGSSRIFRRSEPSSTAPRSAFACAPAACAAERSSRLRREVVSSPDAPRAIGPYSQAIRAGNLLFLSGQIPLHPATNAVVDGDITAQTERVLQNISAVLTTAGASFANVVRTTVFLADMNDFAAMNTVYANYVVDPPPARSTVQVSRLPKDVRVEIDVIAIL